jgi:isoleucyl-tRNA synthetase
MHGVSVDTTRCAGLCTAPNANIDMTMIDKTYQPAEVEGRIYVAWEQAGAFRAGRPERRDARPYCVVIPPPNVTGSLHMGHALNNTLQDVLCRFERMAVAMCCGNLAPIMRGSQPRWWSSGS